MSYSDDYDHTASAKRQGDADAAERLRLMRDAERNWINSKTPAEDSGLIECGAGEPTDVYVPSDHDLAAGAFLRALANEGVAIHPQHPLHDEIEHPAHYNATDIEPIDVIEAWGLGFALGNAVKYIARHEHKGTPLKDLLKARWYLNREITRLEHEEQA